MSRLIDSLKKVSGATPQPMGFRRSPEETTRSRLWLIACIEPDILKSTAGLSAADAVVCRGAGTKEAAMQELSQALPETPCGIWRDTADSGETKKEDGSAADFMVFPVSAPLAATGKGKVGNILAVSPAMDTLLLRAVNDLPVDAVMVSGDRGKAAPLTYESLLFFRLCASVLEKPLIVSAPLEISGENLQVLWDAGINGLVVAVENSESMGKLAGLYGKIKTTSFSSRRKSKKVEPLLPAISLATGEMDEEEDDE